MNETAPILAIETSGEICGACVYYNENKFFDFNIKLKNAHSEKLFGLIDAALNSAGITLTEINAIAVSAGPGSFTGLRIGMAAAKGLCIGQNKPIICAPTFDAAAYQISRFVPEGTKFVIASKTNVDELYCAKYEKHNGLPKLSGSLSVIRKNDISQIISDGSLLFCNEKFNIIDENKLSPMPSGGAKIIAEWSYFFGKDLLTYNLDFIEPNYLKEFVIKVKK